MKPTSRSLLTGESKAWWVVAMAASSALGSCAEQAKQPSNNAVSEIVFFVMSPPFERYQARTFTRKIAIPASAVQSTAPSAAWGAAVEFSLLGASWRHTRAPHTL